MLPPDLKARATPWNVSALAAVSGLVQLCVFLVALLLLWSDGISESNESLIYFLFFTLGPLLSFAALQVLGDRLPQGMSWQRSNIAMAALMLAAPVAIAVFGLSHVGNLVYFTYETPPPRVPFSYSRFLIGFVLFAAVAAAVAYFFLYASSRGAVEPRRARLPFAAKAMGLGIIVSLFDIYLMIDTFCFAPYIAPAFLALEGQIPLVDVFSQYGPNFLLFAAAFKVLPQSFFAAGAIVAVLDVVMYMTFVGIVVNISRNKLPVFVAAIGCVLFIHGAHLYNINFTPSVFGMRFLPPLLLAFSFTLLRPERMFSVFSVFTLGLCSLWSLEALAFGVLMYSAYVVLCSMGERLSPAQAARRVACVAGVTLAPHLVWSAIYVFILGVPPDYGTYLELVFFHFKEGEYWKLPIEAGIRVWAFFGFVYATALALAAHAAFQSLRGKATFSRSSAIVGAVSVLGILMLYYYIGRSATPILMFISLPLFAIVLAALDWAIGTASQRRMALGQPVEAAAPLILVALLVGFPLMGGVFVDKFFRPFSQHLSNSSVLRAWIPPFGEKPVRFRERIQTMRRTTAAADGYPDNEAGGSLTYTYPENRDAFELVRQLHDGKRRIFVFIADPVPVLFHTPPSRRQAIAYPPHQVGVAYPAVDGLSATLHRRALAALDTAAEGDIGLIGELPRPPLDADALSKLRQSWLLCKLASKPKVTAYALRPKHDSSCDPPSGS